LRHGFPHLRCIAEDHGRHAAAGRRDKQSTDDWLRVTAWMDQAATEIDDLETLGTDDLRRELRDVR
jgi:hypothetical protein